MYAIVEILGNQYKVAKGDEIKTQKIRSKEGAAYEAKKVLLIKEAKKITVGTPYVKGKSVTFEVVKHIKSPKTVAYKYKRRKKSRRKKGHRQQLTLLKTKEIG